jgi:hypothetical protein
LNQARYGGLFHAWKISGLACNKTKSFLPRGYAPCRVEKACKGFSNQPSKEATMSKITTGLTAAAIATALIGGLAYAQSSSTTGSPVNRDGSSPVNPSGTNANGSMGMPNNSMDNSPTRSTAPAGNNANTPAINTSTYDSPAAGNSKSNTNAAPIDAPAPRADRN